MARRSAVASSTSTRQVASGDKTSMAVGPIVAACGVPFGKMSGRGLGHTGGTLDKLESIPGFRVELTTDEFVTQVRETGLAIVGQSADLVPADKKLYALRDVTATVDIVPLIASSIMSKKLAARGGRDRPRRQGGRRRVHEDPRRRRHPRRADDRPGRRAGREVVCLLTDMSQPLGAAVGNALEIREAVDDDPRRRPSRFHRARARRVRAPPRALRPRDRRRRGPAPRRGGGRRRIGARRLRALDPAQGGDPSLERLPVRQSCDRSRSAGRRRGRLDALAIGIAALRARRRPAHEGRSDRPCGRRRLPGQARRRGRGRRRARRGHAGDEAAAGAASRRPRRIRDRRRGAARHDVLLDVIG